MGLNTELPPGFKMKVTANASGGWEWEISQFRRVVLKGVEPSRKEATFALKKALGGAVVDAATVRQDRNLIKLKLRSWIERRPYVAMHVFQRALDGLQMAEIINMAEVEELELWKRERERCGNIIKELGDHPLRKKAYQVADEICGCIKKLEWKMPQLKKYAEEMFGPAFFNPDITIDEAISQAFESAQNERARADQ